LQAAALRRRVTVAGVRHGLRPRGFRGLHHRGIFFGLHHAHGGGLLVILVIVLLVILVVLALRRRG
jgi:hypothetical protein